MDNQTCFNRTVPCADQDYCTSDVCSLYDGKCLNVWIEVEMTWFESTELSELFKVEVSWLIVNLHSSFLTPPKVPMIRRFSPLLRSPMSVPTPSAVTPLITARHAALPRTPARWGPALKVWSFFSPLHCSFTESISSPSCHLTFFEVTVSTWRRPETVPRPAGSSWAEYQ